MIGWLIAIGYVTAALMTARKVAYALIIEDGTGPDDKEDRILAAALGLLAGAAWPIAAMAMMVLRSVPKTPAELKSQVEDAEARAAAAEESLRRFAAEHGEEGQRGIIRSGDDEWRF